MHKRQLKYLYLLVVLLYGQFHLSAQRKDLFFKRFTIADGLSQNSVYSITQDHNDFIWLATGKGLNRFDGYDFVSYFHNPKDTNSLSHSRVLDVEVDKWNRLWLATNAGVNCYDQTKDIFYHFRADKNNPKTISEDMVKDILIDKKGFLWVATRSGLNVSLLPLDSIKDLGKGIDFYRFPFDSLTDNLIIRLMEDPEGNIWATTILGLNKINAKTFHVTQYYPGGTKEPSSKNWVSSVAIADSGKIWVGTRGGLFLLDENGFKCYNDHPFFKKNIGAKGISSLLKDKYNRLWIGSFTAGLILYNAENDRFVAYKHNKSNLYSLANNHAYFLFINKQNDLFVSSFAKGFAIANIEPVNFHLFLYNRETEDKTHEIRRIVYDKNGGLWLGLQEDGLYHFDLKSHKIKHYPLTQLSGKESKPTVKAVLENNDGTLWIGTLTKGLHLFDPRKNKFLKELKINERSIQTVFDIKKDKYGNLWIASWQDGLFKLDAKNKKLIHYTKDINNSDALNNNNITSIYISNDERIWLTTWGGGLNILDTKTGKFKHYTDSHDSEIKLLSNFCTVLYRDKRGSFWLGSIEGLCMFDEFTKKTNTFNTESVIDNEIIFSIEEDNNANLWIGTNYGLVRFSISNFSVVNYEEPDGIPSNEYYIGSSCKLPDRKLVFGSKNGLLMFDPDSISTNSFNVQVNITNFQISYKNISTHTVYEKERILKKSILATDTLELSYKNNILSFEFSACNYTKPENIRYAYILEGFNNEWNYVDARKRFAVYTNLEPGTYTLKIKAANLDGTWSPNIRKLVIIINSPFWKTRSFVFISFLAVLLAVIIFFRVRNRYILKQKKQLEMIVQKRTGELESKNAELIKQKEEIAFQKEELFTLSEQLQALNKKLEDKVKERTQKLKETLKKAESSEKMISSFLANFSHEIRTPMNAISGFVQLLVASDFSEENKQKYADIINTNIDTLLHLIENVMEVAKLHSGQYKVRNSVFDLTAMCVNVYQELKPLIKEKVKFVSKLDKIEGMKLYADQRAFRQIIYNLLENAFKYTEEGMVTLECSVDKPNMPEYLCCTEPSKAGYTLKVIISDTGIGIKKENHQNIFNVFSKPEVDKNKVIRGTGLGLALVKELSERLQAQIELKSELNKGTRFCITIPLTECEEKPY